MKDLTDGMNAIIEEYFAPMFADGRQPSLECPCKRTGQGCYNYSVAEVLPYYYCKFTGEPAFVPADPNDSGEVGGSY